ncbi:hypothetical protein Y71_14960 [Kosakonia radicincitans DSM 16656]|uniref:hypothetical protein n=1 Tax=Kosakonia radicincitans TaxID=283686 RepID=UPI0002730C2F|nr:hypothetical protein [Kosakonia radicincitans]ARD61156.1 hypothetical protein Y71_14960 [Kosakonia radicincitans DSM 16656]
MLILAHLSEKAMHVTFKDIKQRYKELQDKHSDRKFELQESARTLVSEYIESLSLPSASWVDANKVPHPYVSVGYLNEKGLFQQMPFAGFDLDKEYKLKFKVSTVVDDSEYGGGSYHLVSVALWKEKNRLHVDVGDGKKTILVSDPTENNAFFEVCRAVKELVISGVTDPRLD